ncbi:MAG TPA: hypothetical protein VJ793_11495 [Anaerolineae bacterium]|nr:hypothetical protein [Anaerolineae bacterium]
MNHNPERLAWTVMLLSFGMCVALAISVPLGIQSFLTNTTDPAPLVLDVQQGAVLLKRPASSDFILVPDQTTDVPDGSIIRADQATQAILTMRDPDLVTNRVVVQLYANTEVTLEQASSPRFGVSPNPHRLDLFVTTGRVRINVLNGTNRGVTATARSPQGEVIFTPGTYAMEVTNEELQITAREGEATVSAQGSSVTIEPSQRAVVRLGQPPEGGLAGERPLIVNGSFTAPLDPAWRIEHGPQDETEPPGSVITTTIVGRRAAVFERTGPSHAETRLVQDLNRDVTDAASLTLHFAVLVNFQDVPVCGSVGTECPMMVKIDYRDTSGANREWLRGFYAVNDRNNFNKPFCDNCTRRFEHQRVLSNTWVSYDSGNLIDVLTTPDGFKPTRITRITFYASGHSYRSAIIDVELLMQD